MEATSTFLVLLFTLCLLKGSQAQLCVDDLCDLSCKKLAGMSGGQCVDGSCNCFGPKESSNVAEELLCNKICEKVGLDGECDGEGHCNCKLVPKPCDLLECLPGCVPECLKYGLCFCEGVVYCVEYGPITNCGISCGCLGKKSFNYRSWGKIIKY